MPPYTEDSAVCNLAEQLGLSLSRHEGIEITDEQAIKEAGLMKQTPDYAAIRRAMRGGAEVPGAKWKGSVEYVLRRNGL